MAKRDTKKREVKKRDGGKRMRKADVARVTMEFFKENPKRVLNYKQVAHALGFKTEARRELLMQVLYDLLAIGRAHV